MMLLRFLFALVLLLPSMSWAAFTFNESKTGAGSGTTLALAAENLAAGSLNVACFKWETAGTTLTSITDTAGNTYTLRAGQTHAAGEPIARCGYVLSTSSNASNVVTGNFSGSVSFSRGAVFEFTYSGTASFDVDAAYTRDDADLTPSSNTLTTTGTDEVCVAFQADFTTQTFSSRTINGVAADGNANPAGDVTAWYKIFAATFTSGASSLTRTATGEWIQTLQCYKATGGGGGATVRNLSLMGVGQ